MTNDVSFNLQQARGRSLGSQVPRFRPNLQTDLTNISSVQPEAAQAAAQAAESDAQNARQRQQLAQQEFQKEIERKQTLQTIEAEKRLSELQLQAQQSAQQIVQTADPEQITQKTLESFDQLSEQHLSADDLSSFQKRLMQRNMRNIRDKVANQARQAQSGVENVEAEIKAQEKVTADAQLVASNPALLDDKAQELKQDIDNLGGLSRERRIKLKAGIDQTLYTGAVNGLISSDPQSALDFIENKDPSKFGIGPEKVQQLREDARAEFESQIDLQNKIENEQQERAEADITDKFLAMQDGERDQQGNPIQVTIPQIRGSGASPSFKRSMVDRLRDERTRAGNSALAARLHRKALQGNLSRRELIEASTGDPDNGIPGLSRSQLTQINQSVTEPGERVVNRAIEDVVRPLIMKVDEQGNPINPSPRRQQALFEIESELRKRADRFTEQGRDPAKLVTRGSGEFILDNLVQRFSGDLDSALVDTEDISFGQAPGEGGEGQDTQQQAPNLPDGIPKGSKLIPNKRHKDGRRLYRTPDGRVMAP